MNNKLGFTIFVLSFLVSGDILLSREIVDPASPEPPLSPYADRMLHDNGSQPSLLFQLDGLKIWSIKPSVQGTEILFTTQSGLLVRGRIFGPDGADITALLTQKNDEESHTAADLKGRRAGAGEEANRSPTDAGLQLSETTQAMPAQSDAPATANANNATASEFTNLAQLRIEADNYAMWIEANHFKPDAPVLYMFVDPLCVYCAKSLALLNPYLERGDIQLRIVPTPILSPLSFERAVRLLQISNPGEAFIRDALSGQQKQLEQSAPPGDPMEAAIVNAMARNVKWFRKNGLKGVPFYLYRSEAGDQAFYGQIDDSRISDILLGEKSREGERLEQ